MESYLTQTQVDLNEILLCKGIGVLHLAVGIDPIEKSRECTELLLKHGAVPNLWYEDIYFEFLKFVSFLQKYCTTFATRSCSQVLRFL